MLLDTCPAASEEKCLVAESFLNPFLKPGVGFRALELTPGMPRSGCSCNPKDPGNEFSEPRNTQKFRVLGGQRLVSWEFPKIGDPNIAAYIVGL